MILTVVKIAIRVVGTLAGVLGLIALWMAGFLVYRHRTIEEQSDQLIFLFFFLPVLAVFAAFLLYTTYLVWFRYSPIAVRHICGALGLAVLSLFMEWMEPFRDADWMPMAFLGTLLAVYLAYRAASDRLSRRLFPEARIVGNESVGSDHS